MLDARPKRTVVALALALVAALVVAHGRGARARDGAVEAGVVVSNRAEATYTDADGAAFATVSPTVSVTVVAVAGLAVTPDETEPSATVAPRERVARLFRVCNTGNTPDFYTLTAAEATAPAALVSLHFDLDSSGTLSEGDRHVTLSQTMSPRLARGGCVGVVATVDTGDGQPGQQFSVRLTARSNVLDAVGGGAQDLGTVVNVFGTGARLTSPDDSLLPPVKLVEGRDRATASVGQTLNFLISFRNGGDVEARGVVLRDDLPAGLDYVAGTLRLEGDSLTDAEDADQGLARDRRLEVRFAKLSVGAAARVSFQARVATALAPGTGLVNTALLTADNAPAASSTNATAVVNPYGLVYQGRSAGTPIAGARVALVGDPAGGALVALTSDGGTAPNDANSNPFVSDGQGRWSFVLAPAQLGSASAPARYFLNVTAPGYRARLVEVSVTPAADATGLFALTVRALDGQPVAQAGGFELTESAVEIGRLAAFALNVPMFENAALELTKSADRPSAEVGDVVTYRVEVHNATPVAVSDLVVRDQLPPSFHYAAGTARVEAPPEPARGVEPEAGPDGALTFRLGRLASRSRATLLYRVRVGANAREGEQFNSAQGAGVLSTGERVSTAAARAAVRVRRGVFSSQQVILGRVFEDANANGLFDRDEKGLPEVRIYLNNGQSVVTDPAGLYNFPVVNEGAQVLSLDPVTLPGSYAATDTGRREDQTWTRLLRTPLGGGALLRQNFALRAVSSSSSASSSPAPALAHDLAPPPAAAKPQLAGSLFGANDGAKAGGEAKAAAPAPQPEGPAAAGTYEMVTTETLAPVAPGAVRVVSPRPEETVLNASLEVSAQVNGAWSVAVEVEGRKVPDSKVGERRLDRKNDIATFTFVGVNVAPGPNRIRVTAVGPEGQDGQSVELVAYGRGPAKRLEILTDKPELAAGGRDRTTVRVRAFDQWDRPAADGSVALEVSEGRLLRAEVKDAPAPEPNDRAENPQGPAEAASANQQIVPLVGGEGRAVFVAGGAPGETQIRATTGTVEAKRPVRVTPEVRSAILVGLAEVTVGAGGPELTAESDALVRSRLAFFYRGQFLGSNLLTLAYDSNRPVNRTGGRDRLFQFDPLDRAYPLFGDSSTRSEDAQSNSKLYLRVDRGRSYFLFGDFESDNKEVGLASYTRRLTGAKLHLENAGGDYVSVSGARPDTAFARDVFPGGTGGFTRLSHAEILPGSETVVIEVRDRRNPEVILSREALIRAVDYNLDASTGEIFFLRPVSTFDFSFNLVQTVVTYEYAAAGMSSAVYTARAFKTFEGAGLRLGLSYVDQRQGEFGAFRVGGLDAEKSLPGRGRLRAEWATSRGRAAVGGNLFDAAAGDERHDGDAFRVQLEQPLPWREAVLRAGFLRVEEGFLNPFGETVTPGSQRADASVEMKAGGASRVRLSFADERNRTANVDNSRQTASLLWTQQFGERLRATFGYDFRRFRDDLEGEQTDSNLVTAGAEWQATDKLQLAAKREQNLSGEADPTYPDQTTLGATYQWNKYTRLFFTQRFSSAPITPIADPTGGGFFSTGARQETAVGVETRLGRVGNFVSRYQLENGVNGSDSFAVVGLSNRLALSKQLGLDFGYERGFHLAGGGESFNSGHLGFTWQPAEDFRTTARYEARDRGGAGSILTLGAQGRLFDNLTSLARFQLSRTDFDGRAGSALSMTAALAWRPLESDRAGLLFSYTRRDLAQEGTDGGGETRDRSDTLSSDWYYQATRRLELYGRFALRFGETATPELARVSTFTYMTQGRALYRFGRYFDVAGEARWLAQPASSTSRTSLGAELGYWVLADLRLGGGYNWVGVGEPFGGQLAPGRRGFYFTISSKLSNLFDLFGTPKNNAQAEDDAQGRKKEE